MGNISTIIEFAIEREKEAQEIYMKYSKSTNQQGFKKLLVSMADQEKEHEKRLLELREGKKMDEIFSKSISSDLSIEEYLVEVEFSPDMSYQDFLILIMKKEEKSFKLYEDLSKKTDDTEVKLLLNQLAEEEKKHKAWAQDRYDLEILSQN